MRVVLIVNPISGHGRSLRAASRAAGVFAQAGWQVESRPTRGPGEAGPQALEAAREGYDVIFACGGDGTLSQVAAALLDQGVPAGVIPAGTGNDFARTIGLSRDPATAARQILAGRPQRVDILQVNGGRLWCLNVMGTGFDAAVCRRINARQRLLSGVPAYLMAVAQEFISYRPTPVSLEIDGQTWEGSVMLAAVANAQSYGAGMRISPLSDVQDGLLDVVVVRHVGRLEFARSFPRVFKGTHLAHPAVRHWRGRQVRLFTPNPSPVLVDGDLQCETPLEVRVCPARALLWMPGKPQ